MLNRDVSLALVLATAFLAGCLAPAADLATSSGAAFDAHAVAARLSAELPDVTVLHEVLAIPAHDGKAMEVDLWRPDVDERVPVILVASPYNNPPGEGGKDPATGWVDLRLYEWIERELIPRGYAFAQMDIRGTRHSDGCMEINTPGERRSTAAVIEALAAAEWSNGRVGMIGKSYLAKSQTGAAIERPQGLATIVPISGVSHQYGYHYYNAVPYAANVGTNFFYMTGSAAPPPDRLDAETAKRYPERFTCMPEQLAAGADPRGDYSERWKERDYRPHVKNVEASVLFVHGLQDWNVKPDHILDFYDEIPSTKMALLGQWAHDYPDKNYWDEATYGAREDWYFLLHRWFDHWLKGIDTGLLDEVAACPVQTQGSDAVWRCLDDYPPDAATNLTLYPTADGALAAAPGSGAVQYFDGSPDSKLEFRVEVEETTRVAGAPVVRLRSGTTSAVTTHWIAELRVDRGDGPVWTTAGYLDAAHRETLERATPTKPGELYEVAFRMYPVDLVLEPGDALVLRLTGASLRVLPNPAPGVVTVELGPTTALDLPVVPTERAFVPTAYDALPDAYRAPE